MPKSLPKYYIRIVEPLHGFCCFFKSIEIRVSGSLAVDRCGKRLFCGG
jgi:hypothetical protein